MTDDERDRGEDELFGDLDEFFAPIEDVDWPDESEAGQEEGEEPRPEGEPGDLEEEWVPEFDIPEDDELDAETPEPALEAEETEPEPEPEPGPEEPEEPEEPEPVAEPEEPEPVAEPEEPEPVAERGEPAARVGPEEPSPPEELDSTAEMSGEDWERLRSALGDDVEPLEEERAEPPPGDLRIEDLRTPPAPYADLPAGERRADVPEEPPPETELDQDAVLAEEATFESDEPLEPDATRTPLELEEEEEDVEAAAAHFATGLEPEAVERDLLADLQTEPEEPSDEPPSVEPVAPVEAGAAGEEEPAVTRVEEAPPEDEEALPLGGVPPTWQEPAAYAADEEMAEAEEEPAEPGERNLTAAAASGAILALAALSLLAIGKGPFVVLAIALVLLGQGELYAVLHRRGFQPATAMGLVAGLFVMVGAYTRGEAGQGEAAMLFGLAVGTMLSILWYMAAPPASRKGLVANVAATMLGVVYVPFLISFALLLLAVPGDIGRNYLLAVIGLTVLYDLTAYAIGTLWGNRPLAPTVSPRKSWEGAIGATFVVLLVALAIVPTFDPFTAPLAAGLALVIAVAAPLGDLAESAIKRDLGVKDMGSLLPGHGGVLDRFDAILFAAPAAYYFLRLFG